MMNFKDYVKTLGADEIVAKILFNRGVDIDIAKTILTDWHKGINDPRTLLNTEDAATKITEYCSNKKAEIIVFGDYDIDGVTSTYIMTDSLRKVAKCRIVPIVPERKDGYGINMNLVDKLIQQKEAETDKNILVITVDNGINQTDEINKLIDNGIEVVVTDHHELSKPSTPNCICVNPWIETEDTNKHLAGCAVAFKVAQVVLWNFNKGEKMMEYTPYVALGTVGDVMPFSVENMCFIQYGLEIINSNNCPRGIKSFKGYYGYKTITTEIIGWNLGPIINACGRMGNTALAYKMFDTTLLQVDSEIEDIVIEMISLNEKRKKQTQNAMKVLKQQDFSNDKVCVVKLDNVTEGIAGNIAGKIKDEYNKPTIVLVGEEIVKGSARSIDNIDINSLIQSEIKKGVVLNGGGHDVAAGLSLEEKNIQTLRENLNKALKDVKFKTKEEIKTKENDLIDGELTLDDVNRKTYNLINMLPYGNGFKEPVLSLDIEIDHIKISSNNKNNICFYTKNKKQIWAWGFAKKYEELNSPDKLTLIGNVCVDFRNAKDITFKIKDIKTA